MALRKVCVRDFGALVVRRFAYAKSFAYAIRVASKNRVAYAKSRTQNRVAYANRVRKSRTQIAPSVRKSHSVKSQQKSRTQNRVAYVNRAQLDSILRTRRDFAYAILRTRRDFNPPLKIAYAKSFAYAICVRLRDSRSLNPWLNSILKFQGFGWKGGIQSSTQVLLSYWYTFSFKWEVERSYIDCKSSNYISQILKKCCHVTNKNLHYEKEK